VKREENAARNNKEIRKNEKDSCDEQIMPGISDAFNHKIHP